MFLPEGPFDYWITASALSSYQIQLYRYILKLAFVSRIPVYVYHNVKAHEDLHVGCARIPQVSNKQRRVTVTKVSLP